MVRLRCKSFPAAAAAVAALAALLLIIICAVLASAPDRREDLLLPESPDIAVLGKDGEIFEIPLEEFLVGVVAAEMPSSFADGALAAQAVAARTYILSAFVNGGRHKDAVVCCDPGCCQAWRDPEELAAAGNLDGRDKVAAAVAETAGLALYYQGRLAEAPFYSCCGGRTESAVDCWGGERPWLVSVECGYCTHAPRFCSCVTFSLTEAAALLDCSEDELKSMQLLGYTSGGRVAGVELGEGQIKGTQVRSALSLNSAAFTWLIQGDRLLVATMGFGHGVGLCQYGADGMASSGFSYQEILTHYYSGCLLQPAY